MLFVIVDDLCDFVFHLFFNAFYNFFTIAYTIM